MSALSWQDIYAWAGSLSGPAMLPPDPKDRINISPSRLRRKSDPDSMVWETLPVTFYDGTADIPSEAKWPYLPHWSRGKLPTLKTGKLLATANARLRREGEPFAPTFMHAWKRGYRAVVWVSWFYEFDSRVHPQIPWAVFPLDQPFWAMAGLLSFSRNDEGIPEPSVAVITVEPNRVLTGVGHHRSPALLRDDASVDQWLHGEPDDALSLLEPHPDESMGVETVPMGIKIPGNQDIELPAPLTERKNAPG